MAMFGLFGDDRGSRVADGRRAVGSGISKSNASIGVRCSVRPPLRRRMPRRRAHDAGRRRPSRSAAQMTPGDARSLRSSTPRGGSWGSASRATSRRPSPAIPRRSSSRSTAPLPRPGPAPCSPRASRADVPDRARPRAVDHDPARDPIRPGHHRPELAAQGPGFVAPIGQNAHFPPRIKFTPEVGPFEIEHTNRDSIISPGPDHIRGTADDIALQSRFNANPAYIPAGESTPPPESYGLLSGLLPDAQSRGLGTLARRHPALQGAKRSSEGSASSSRARPATRPRKTPPQRRRLLRPHEARPRPRRPSTSRLSRRAERAGRALL